MEREPLFLQVEIGGEVVHREAEPLHLYDERGQHVFTRMRPVVRPGEILVDRLGTFPRIIQELA